MSVDEIEKAIVKLSPEDRAKLVARLAELDALEWDKQIEADSKSGKLEKLLQESEADFRAGNCREL